MSTHSQVATRKLIDIESALKNPIHRKLYAIIKNPIERGLAVKHLNDTYAHLHETDGHDNRGNFFNTALETLHVNYALCSDDLERIPQQGPVVMVANHPFGGLDGVIMGSILSRVRHDFKILGNYMLQQFEEMRELLISVDPFEQSRSTATNIGPIRESIRWVKEGGALMTFPAGEVSHLFVSKGWVADRPWSPHVGGIIRKARATAVPVFFNGRNSALFQLAGLLHPRFRTVMLPRELLKKTAHTVDVRIGKPIPWSKLKRFENNRALTNYLRINTYILKEKRKSTPVKFFQGMPFCRKQKSQAKIAPPIERSILEKEVASLPKHQHLVQSAPFSVYIASAPQIPQALKEIGRLREMTFRDVQEGTGRSRDLDRFDTSYLHLFLWNGEQQEIAGAYRLGLADAILNKQGSMGLYSSTLFRYQQGFYDRLDNAIELGRSFVRTDYQKKQGCLFLLWRGLGAFIAQQPRYTVLFGPVSISQDYHTISKDFMVQFLSQNKRNDAIAQYVRPRTPHRSCRVLGINRVDKESVCSSIAHADDVSALISEVERDGKGMPVLLRHYLKLNAQLLSFNEDKAFSNVVDGLIWVDLTKTRKKLLKRYMGDEAFSVYSAFHGWN